MASYQFPSPRFFDQEAGSAGQRKKTKIEEDKPVLEKTQVKERGREKTQEMRPMLAELVQRGHPTRITFEDLMQGIILRNGNEAGAGERGLISTDTYEEFMRRSQKTRKPVEEFVRRGSPTTKPAEGSRFLREWTQDRFLGSGAYGEVYIYIHCYSGEEVAVKKVNIQPLYAQKDASVKGLKELRNEIGILMNLTHERIVRYRRHVESDGHLYLFMDYMVGGSLYDKIQSKGVLSELSCVKYTGQILEGVSFLHSQNIAHRDIKARNVLLEHNGDAKLADFGVSKEFQKSCSNSKTNFVSNVGTSHWMAPEVILAGVNNQPYGRKADIWSVGCTVVEMLTGRPPLGDLEPVAAIFKIGIADFKPERLRGVSFAANDFIRVSLTRDPNKRPQAEELLSHPFISSFYHYGFRF